ncbi:hypothetical protein IIA15_03810 [candidate division TA06 bacterium]|nr:hypothetical protein [candidate division TA06 bacterium]
MSQVKHNFVSVLSLFTSASTLLCCALPTLLVTLGLGAMVAAGVSAVPFWSVLSREKGWVFLGSGILLGLNLFLVYRRRPKPEACRIDGKSGCDVAGRWNRRLLLISVSIWSLGLFVAYLAFPLLSQLGLL